MKRFKGLTGLSFAFLLTLCMVLSGCQSPVSSSSSTASTSAMNSGSPSSSVSTSATVDGSQVGVVLPTKAEPRWPMAEKTLKDLMPAATILYSNGDTATEKTNVESLIAKKMKVIIICAQDGTAAAAEVTEAHNAGISVISYDRLIMNTPNVDYYVTFGSVGVGVAQAQYLVDQVKGTGNHLYLYAGAASDNNSFLFFQGSWSVLQPKIADGTFVIENSSIADSMKSNATLTHDQESQIIGQITTNWDPTTAKTLAQANIAKATADQKGACYVLSPNDATCRAITDAFRADTAVTSIYSTGQDFALASLQYIMDGKQGMDLYMPDKLLVQNCTDICNAIMNNTKATCIVTTYNNGSKDVPATKATLTTVTKDNLAEVANASGSFNVSGNTVTAVN
jgi:putative multiple sugar transport system substrate-binding protein